MATQESAEAVQTAVANRLPAWAPRYAVAGSLTVNAAVKPPVPDAVAVTAGSALAGGGGAVVSGL
nr:hypothetical protein GCM10020092_035690 [Actinoplanes digitatis]